MNTFDEQCVFAIMMFDLDVAQLTPPMSNDDENKRPTRHQTKEISSEKEKKSSTNITTSSNRPVQYRILQRGQPDEVTSIVKKTQLNDSNTPETTTTSKSQRNRRKKHLG
jgi:hypothetical protein